MGDWSRTLRSTGGEESARLQAAAEHLGDALGSETELEEGRPCVGVLAIPMDAPALQLEDAHAGEAHASSLAAGHRGGGGVAERPLRSGPPLVLDDHLHAPVIVAALVELALEHAAQGRLPRVRPIEEIAIGGVRREARQQAST